MKLDYIKVHGLISSNNWNKINNIMFNYCGCKLTIIPIEMKDVDYTVLLVRGIKDNNLGFFYGLLIGMGFNATIKKYDKYDQEIN